MRLIDITAKTFPTPYRINNTEHAKGWNSCLNSVLQQPVVDAVPVVHGHWVEINSPIKTEYECSVCHKKDSKSTAIRGHYCWYCGAKMDEVSE